MTRTESDKFLEAIIEGGFSPKQYAHAYGLGYVWAMLTEEQKQSAVKHLQTAKEA